MNINLIDHTKLTVTPETAGELHDLLKDFRIEPDNDLYFEKVQAFKAGNPPQFEDLANRSMLEGNGGFERFTIATAHLQPYWDELKDQLGTEPFDLVFPIPHLPFKFYVACYVEALEYKTEDQKVHFTTVESVYNYQGRVFPSVTERRARGESNAFEHLSSMLWTAQPESEYIDAGNGFFKRNPKYGSSRMRYRTEAGHGGVLLYMANQWLERFATPGQKAMVARIHRADRAELDWCNTRGYNDGFHIDGCKSHISFKEFQTL